LLNKNEIKITLLNVGVKRTEITDTDKIPWPKEPNKEAK